MDSLRRAALPNPTGPDYIGLREIKTAAGAALAEIKRLKTERLKLDRRIHNQRIALRKNWEIIEMRAQYKRAWYPSKLLISILHNQATHKR